MRKAQVRPRSDGTARPGLAAARVPPTGALGPADAALNYDELDSGDSFAFGVHAHGEADEDQEEAFSVGSGAATFRPEPGEEGQAVVARRERCGEATGRFD